MDPADVVAAALAALDEGNRRKADEILRHAAHKGAAPIDLLVAGTHRPAAHPTLPEPTEGPMHVTYNGPGPGVRLAPTLGDIWCPRGEAVEVPDEVGRSLCEQPHFAPARSRRRRSEMPGDPRAGTEVPESPDPSDETR